MAARLVPTFPAECALDIRLKYIADQADGPVLNLGSGVNPIQGAINHGAMVTPETPVAFDLTEFPWPVPKDTYQRVLAFHVLEHIPVGLSLQFFQECHRILVVAGALVVEVPDILGQARELLAGNHGMIGRMYGQYQVLGEGHLWGWDAAQLMIVSRLAGFHQTITKPGTDYHSGQIPTVRLEAVKSGRTRFVNEPSQDPTG